MKKTELIIKEILKEFEAELEYLTDKQAFDMDLRKSVVMDYLRDSLSRVAQTAKEEAEAFKGVIKRDWYSKGYKEGAQASREEVIKEITKYRDESIAELETRYDWYDKNYWMNRILDCLTTPQAQTTGHISDTTNMVEGDSNVTSKQHKPVERDSEEKRQTESTQNKSNLGKSTQENCHCANTFQECLNCANGDHDEHCQLSKGANPRPLNDMKTVNLELAKQLKVKTKDRFMKYVQIQKNDCWLWVGGKNKQGYGNFYFEHKTVRAHRFSWLLFKGKLPELHFDHLCRNRACVNVLHLEPVTNQVNVLRGLLGATSRARQLAKTHCPQGHEYTKENIKLYKGRRFCRECALKASRESNKRRYYANR